MPDKPLTATEVKQRQYEFFTRPDVIEFAEKIGKMNRNILDTLINRAKELCQA